MNADDACCVFWLSAGFDVTRWSPRLAGDAQKSQNCGSPTSIVTLRFRKNFARFTSVVRPAAGFFQTMGVAVGCPHYLGLSEGVDDPDPVQSAPGNGS